MFRDTTLPANSGSEVEKANESSTRLERANKVVENLGVKQHLFIPSGIVIWTVVGMDGDFLVDMSSDFGGQYCSCSDFHYRVLSGKVPECYHLIAARMAKKQGIFATTKFLDGELGNFLSALLKDLFAHAE